MKGQGPLCLGGSSAAASSRRAIDAAHGFVNAS